MAVDGTATSISVLPVSSISASPPVPPHANYNPLPGPSYIDLTVPGYLPANNENVLLITSGSVIDWVEKFPSTIPPARSNAMMAYDASNGTVVLFGGLGNPSIDYGYLNDTWVWNGSNWAQAAPSTSPPARYSGMMAYDPGTGTVILFGGSGLTGACSDVWSWNGSNWTELNANVGFTLTCGAMAYDTASSRLILFGGTTDDANTRLVSNTWYWSGSTWNDLAPATSPPARFWANMSDTGGHGLLLFGGRGVGAGDPILADTWLWEGGNWVEQFSVSNPYGVELAVMAYDASLGEVILYGGNSVYGPLSLTYGWKNGMWTQPFPSYSPAALVGCTMAADPGLSGLLLFGGVISGEPIAATYLFASTSASTTNEITNCTQNTAGLLGIPVTPGTTYVFSAYFQPYPQSTPSARLIYLQLNWYGENGVELSTTTGAVFTETIGSWVRAYVVGTAPAGAITMGKTVNIEPGTGYTMMDAVQTEVNTLATAGPTPWQPPRDIQINLLPVRQNLMPNPQGLAGFYGWTGYTGASTTTTPPAGLSWPTGVSSAFLLPTAFSITSTPISVNAGYLYTFSAVFAVTAVASSFMQVYVTFYTANGTSLKQYHLILYAASGQIPANVFTTISLPNMEAPAGSAYVKVSLTSPGLAAGQHCYWTALLLEEGAGVRPFFDGNSNPYTDYWFEGTPNESPSDYYPNISQRLSRLVTAMPDYIPIGATFSLFEGANAFANLGLQG